MCASISSRGTPPSNFPREKANPAEVVASASKPRFSKWMVVPMSHGFGSTKHPDSCIFLNFPVTEVCFAEAISRTYAVLTYAREWNGKRCACPTICSSSKFAVTDLRLRRSDRSAAPAKPRCYDLPLVVRPANPEADPTRVRRDTRLQRRSRDWRRCFGGQLQPG